MVLWGKICLFINAPPSIERSNPVDTGVAYNSNCQHYYLFFNCRKIIHLTDVSQSINCYWIHYYYLLSVGHDGTTIWCSTSLIKGCRILSRLLLTPSYCCKDLMNRVRNFLQYKAAVDNRHCTNNFFFFFFNYTDKCRTKLSFDTCSSPCGAQRLSHMGHISSSTSAEVDAGEIWTVNPRNMCHFLSLRDSIMS